MFTKFYRVQLFLYVMAFATGAAFQLLDIGRLPPGINFYADGGLPLMAVVRVATTSVLALCLFFTSMIMLRDLSKVSPMC